MATGPIAAGSRGSAPSSSAPARPRARRSATAAPPPCCSPATGPSCCWSTATRRSVDRDARSHRRRGRPGRDPCRRHHRRGRVRRARRPGASRRSGASTCCTTTWASAPATRRPTDLDARAWDRIIDVNLKAMWLTCKHVVPAMREQGGGAIVNISSLAAIAAAATLTAYKVSKAGVNALTQTLAVAHAADGIRVNAIMPGLIDTPMGVDARARARGRPRDDAGRRPGPPRAARPPGHGLGRRPRRAVPGLRRSRLHHRRGAAGRRRPGGDGRLSPADDHDQARSSGRSGPFEAPVEPGQLVAGVERRGRGGRDLVRIGTGPTRAGISPRRRGSHTETKSSDQSRWVGPKPRSTACTSSSCQRRPGSAESGRSRPPTSRVLVGPRRVGHGRPRGRHALGRPRQVGELLGGGSSRARLDLGGPTLEAAGVLVHHLAARRRLGPEGVAVGVAGDVGQQVPDRPARKPAGSADPVVVEDGDQRGEPPLARRRRGADRRPVAPRSTPSSDPTKTGHLCPSIWRVFVPGFG